MANKTRTYTPLQREWKRISDRLYRYNKKNPDARMTMQEFRQALSNMVGDLNDKPEDELTELLQGTFTSYHDFERFAAPEWEEVADIEQIEYDMQIAQYDLEYQNFMDQLQVVSPQVQDFVEHWLNEIQSQFGYLEMVDAISNATEDDGPMVTNGAQYSVDEAARMILRIMDNISGNAKTQYEGQYNRIRQELEAEARRESDDFWDEVRARRRARQARYRAARKRRGR